MMFISGLECRRNVHCRSKARECKLAFASILSMTFFKRLFLSFQGVQLLVAFLYNFNETIYNTAAYLDNRQLHLRGSPKAVAGGSFFLLTITSSLYHLTFMSGQRFYAIKWPLKYRMNDRISVRAGLLAIWILSILSATVPGEQCSDWRFANILYTLFAKLNSKSSKNPLALSSLTNPLWLWTFRSVFKGYTKVRKRKNEKHVVVCLLAIWDVQKFYPIVIASGFLCSFSNALAMKGLILSSYNNNNNTRCSLMASLWGICLLGSAFIHFRLFKLAHIRL